MELQKWPKDQIELWLNLRNFELRSGGQLKDMYYIRKILHLIVWMDICERCLTDEKLSQRLSDAHQSMITNQANLFAKRLSKPVMSTTTKY
jgi:hypothetical protein